MLRQLPSVLVLMLTGLSARIMLLPITALGSGSVLLLAVGHGGGSCIAILSPPFHAVRSERVMRSTARRRDGGTGTRHHPAACDLRLRHKVTIRQNAARICRPLPTTFNDLRMALKLRVLGM